MTTTTQIPTSLPQGPQPVSPRPAARGVTILLIALLVAAALAAGLLLGGGGGGEGGQPSSSPALSALPTSSADQPAGPAQAPAVVVVSQQEPTIPTVPPLPPKPQPGVLAVGPSVIDLGAGDWTAEFIVSNVGASDMLWSAVGVPSGLGLSAVKGTLGAGEQTTVTATVDHTVLVKGPFSLTLHVSANDTAQAVTITGTKEIKVAVPPGPGTLTPVTKP